MAVKEINLAEKLPADWDTYGAAEKIDWFNTVGATTQDLTKAGVPQADINWMLQNGFIDGGYTELYNQELTEAGLADTLTEQDKIDLYNELVAVNNDDETLRDYAEEIFGKQTDADWDYLKSRALQDYINEEYGGITSENAADIVQDAAARNVDNELFAEAIGAEIVKEGDNEFIQFTPGFVGPESVRPAAAPAAAPPPAAPAIEYTDQQIADYIAQTYGTVNADNLQAVVDEAIKEGVPIEQVARAIGAGLTPTEGGYSFSLPQAAAPAPTFTDQQVSDYIAQNFGAVNSGNFSDVINAAYGQGFSPEQIARVTGATLSPTEGGFSFSLPAAAPIEYTDQQISDYIAQNYGTVSAENFQAIVDQAVAENVPIEQLARAIGATLDTNEAGQISLTLPPAAVETQPMSLVDQLKAQQAATGITHQASFSKDQDKIIADMADKLGKYGVQDLTDLKPITEEREYFLEPIYESDEVEGAVFTGRYSLYEQNPNISYDGPSPTPIREASADDIAQLNSKGTITTRVGVLNSRTGEEIPVNKLNNAEGSGFTYYGIDFSPDGIAVPYGYKKATGLGAIGDQIKSIISIPPIAAALAAIATPIIGSALAVSAPVAAAVSAGTVGYAGSGRLDTAAKAAATAFTVSYALQALGVDLTADQSARVDAVKDVPGYSSLTRTVDLGGGLTYDPVSNSILDANFGTSLNAATGDIEFPDGSIATAKDYGIYPSAEAAPPGATVTPVSPGSPIVSANLPAASQNTITITGSQVPELSALSGLPVGTRLLNPLTGNPAEITITADGVKQLTNIAAVATGIQTLGPGTTAQVNVTGTKPGATQTGTAGVATGIQTLGPGATAQVNVTGTKTATDQGGAAAGAVQNVSGGNTAQVNVTGTKTDTGTLGSGLTGYEFVTNPITGNTEVVKVTGTKQDTGTAGAGAGAVATTKGPLSTGTTKLTEGRISDLTADEIKALVGAGLLVTSLVASPDSPTTPTTTIDTAAINTLRPGFNVDLTPTIPPGSTTTTTTTPGQQVYTNLGINTGRPTTPPPATPTTGIGSLPVPTYKPPPFLGAQAPGASRITPPVLTADPTFTQADFDFAAAEIARQQAALPPIVQQPPATPFESGLAKGTTVAKRAGGIVALRGGGMPLAFMGGGMTGPVNQPRMLSGGGDGMSDSIPATIDGTQPARLADGEFVIPADVVADIGNGSSNAGAKQLYAMMDRVRQSRHGTTKQPPEVNMNKVLPV